MAEQPINVVKEVPVQEVQETIEKLNADGWRVVSLCPINSTGQFSEITPTRTVIIVAEQAD